MHIRTTIAKAPTRLRHHDIRTYTLRTPPYPQVGQRTKIPHSIPPKENKPTRCGDKIRFSHHRHSAWQRTERRRVYGDTGMTERDWATGAYGDTGVTEID